MSFEREKNRNYFSKGRENFLSRFEKKIAIIFQNIFTLTRFIRARIKKSRSCLCKNEHHDSESREKAGAEGPGVGKVGEALFVRGIIIDGVVGVDEVREGVVDEFGGKQEGIALPPGGAQLVGSIGGNELNASLDSALSPLTTVDAVFDDTLGETGIGDNAVLVLVAVGAVVAVGAAVGVAHEPEGVLEAPGPLQRVVVVGTGPALAFGGGEGVDTGGDPRAGFTVVVREGASPAVVVTSKGDGERPAASEGLIPAVQCRARLIPPPSGSVAGDGSADETNLGVKAKHVVADDADVGADSVAIGIKRIRPLTDKGGAGPHNAKRQSEDGEANNKTGHLAKTNKKDSTKSNLLL